MLQLLLAAEARSVHVTFVQLLLLLQVRRRGFRVVARILSVEIRLALDPDLVLRRLVLLLRLLPFQHVAQ